MLGRVGTDSPDDYTWRLPGNRIRLRDGDLHVGWEYAAIVTIMVTKCVAGLPGSVAVDDAGRGIVHSEMPTTARKGGGAGFQLWLNLLPRQDD